MQVLRYITVCVLVAFAVAVGFGQDSTKTAPDTTKTVSKKTSNHKEKKMTATMETSMGTIEIELYPEDAPKTVENFSKLAEKKYFDGMRIHRIAKNFVIQTGDDKSKDPAKAAEWGTGGQSIWGKEFADELNPMTKSYRDGYKKGVLAMANRGPNTNTSQFFICLADVGLPHNYTIFGKVIKGLDVVDKIGEVEIIPNPQMGPTDGRPKEDIIVKKIRMNK